MAAITAVPSLSALTAISALMPTQSGAKATGRPISFANGSTTGFSDIAGTTGARLREGEFGIEEGEGLHLGLACSDAREAFTDERFGQHQTRFRNIIDLQFDIRLFICARIHAAQENECITAFTDRAFNPATKALAAIKTEIQFDAGFMRNGTLKIAQTHQRTINAGR